jgi:hypothetical protein
MKTASSIRYGGMLVDADECDYDSFKNLGLLCPICKRTVFLVQKSTRSASQRKIKDGTKIDVRSAEIPAYFAHHPEVDKDTVNDCELRSKQITAIQRLHLETKAHNQRRKIMQSHFWKILKTSYELSDPVVDMIPIIIKEQWIRQHPFSERRSIFHLQEFINLFIKTARLVSEEERKEEIDRIIENILKSQKDRLYEEDLRAKEYLDDWIGTLNARMHSSICEEALGFLLHKRQVKMLETMTYFALDAQIYHECRIAARRTGEDFQILAIRFYPNYVRVLTEGKDNTFLVQTLKGMFVKLIGMIVSVRWAYQFELLEQKSINLK